MADFFYGCWFDIPYDVNNLFTRIKDRLPPQIKQSFRDCIDKKSYIERHSTLATRWSVLVSPSLNEQTQRLRISSDDVKEVAKDIVAELIKGHDKGNWRTIGNIENWFFADCIARDDLRTFAMVWFRLGKNDWLFDTGWDDCQQYLDQTTAPLSTS